MLFRCKPDRRALIFRVWVVIAIVVLGHDRAGATWSVVAVDPESREVGIAGASCIAGSSVIAGVAPGKGAVAAQAMWNSRGRDLAVEMLASGKSPAEVIEAVANLKYDWLGLPLYQLRQYGIVALGHEEEPAAFTGSMTLSWQGQLKAHAVSVQGNILVGSEVLDATLTAFQAEPPACPFTLADRLITALEAGASRGGDRRCSREQTALSAFVIVAAPDDRPDAPSLYLIVPDQAKGGANPVTLLRQQYDEWRRLHPPDPNRCSRSVRREMAAHDH